ncbi:MAG: hypothetical protein NTY41_13565 [Proteobacteria bacterium]|nr:hypothetical protein [Pseudomonadota bacterium]
MLAIIASSLAPTRIIKWLGACWIVLAALWMIPAMAQEGGKTVRPEIGKPVQAALDLLKQKKGKDALTKVREAEAVGDKTAHETFLIDQVRGQAAALAGEAAVAARAFEAAAASAAAGEKEKQQFLDAAAGQFYLAKEYGKVADMAGRYFKAGGNDRAIHNLEVQALYLGNNFAQAAKELLQDIQADEQAGKTPAEVQLQLLSSCYEKLQDKAGNAHALEKLLTYYPKKDYWQNVIYSVTTRTGFAERLALDVNRLRLVTGTMRGASDYVEATQMALQSGYPAEARKFIDAGYAAGLLGTGADADRHKRLKDRAVKDTAADLKALGQDDAQLAASQNGTALFNSGLNYVLNGRADKGLGMMESALAKGGFKHPEDAKLQLGYAYYLGGQTQKAIQAFKKVQGSDGTSALSRLWVIRLGQAS